MRAVLGKSLGLPCGSTVGGRDARQSMMHRSRNASLRKSISAGKWMKVGVLCLARALFYSRQFSHLRCIGVQCAPNWSKVENLCLVDRA